MSRVYAVSSGDYSDYVIHCVFEREADALTYVHALNAADMRAQHDANVRAAHVSPNSYTPACEDPIETCPSHRHYWANLHSWTVRVEPFDFYEAGVVPLANARSQDSRR